MCDSVATTDEHAPPMCIFPTQKDTINNINYRKNLIKVPSCPVHNTEKSKDDEYLLYILSLCITSNNIGLQQFLTKVQRAYKRRPALIKAITKHYIPVKVVDSIDDSSKNTIAVEIDRLRIEDVLEKTTRALYFFEFKETFLGEVQIIPEFLFDVSNFQFNKEVSQFVKDITEITNACTQKGKNSSVFYYKIYLDNDKNTSFIEMVFYGTSKVFGVLNHKKVDK